MYFEFEKDKCNKKLKKVKNWLDEIWESFIFSENLNEYFGVKQPEKLKSPSKILTIKMLRDFMNEYKLCYTDNLSITLNEDENLSTEIKMASKYILKCAKFWVIYIHVMNFAQPLSSVMNIFNYASAIDGIDIYFLFECFILYLNKLDSEYLVLELSALDLNETVPKNFKILIGQIQRDKLTSQFFENYEDEVAYNNFNEKLNEKMPLEFSFFSHEPETNAIEGSTASAFAMDLNYEMDKKLKDIFREDEMKNELLQEDLIIDQIDLERSPDLIFQDFRKHSPMFFNRSPTLDSYLLPSANDNNFDYAQINAYSPKKLDMNKELEKFENLNLVRDEEEEQDEFSLEKNLNQDNLILVNQNFNENSNFAIFLLTNKLKKHFCTFKDQCYYLITPLNCGNSITKKIKIQEDLDNLRDSVYKDFVYTPFNQNLLNIFFHK